LRRSILLLLLLPRQLASQGRLLGSRWLLLLLLQLPRLVLLLQLSVACCVHSCLSAVHNR
jgi:hypothetical protein